MIILYRPRYQIKLGDMTVRLWISKRRLPFLMRADALIVLINPTFFVQRRQIVERAATHRLPAIYEWKEFVRSGGLISYGADVSDVYRRAAGLVDKILKGAKPADLPVEGPTRFELAVNLKAANALGLTIPQSVRAQAFEAIE